MAKKYDKKGGRPQVDDAKYKGKMLSVRLDPMDEARLEKLVRRSGKKASEVLRGLIADGRVKECVRREHLDYMAQLKGIARNLNQLTRQANIAGFAWVAPEHERMVGEIEKHLKRIRDDW